MDDDEALAEAAARLFGIAAGRSRVFFLGLVIIYSDLLREGGWPQVGAIVCIMGVIDAVFAPSLLKKAWDQQDRQERP